MNKAQKTKQAQREAQKLSQETRRIKETEHSQKEYKTKKLSKALSYVLRHDPDSIGITLNDGGWTKVSLLRCADSCIMNCLRKKGQLL